MAFFVYYSMMKSNLNNQTDIQMDNTLFIKEINFSKVGVGETFFFNNQEWKKDDLQYASKEDSNSLTGRKLVKFDSRSTVLISTENFGKGATLIGNAEARDAEDTIERKIRQYFNDRSDYRVMWKPKTFKHIFEMEDNNPIIQEAIRNKVRSRNRSGLVPECMITYMPTKRGVVIEAKHQYQRGNAQERAARYFAPRLASKLRKMLNLNETECPVRLIFMGEMVMDMKYLREIVSSYEKETFLMWNEQSDAPLCGFLDSICEFLEKQ